MRRWLWLLVLGLGVVAAPSLARAQEEVSEETRSQSHHLPADKFGLPGGNTEELFKERLHEIDLLKKIGVSEKQMKQAQEYLKAHPEIREQEAGDLLKKIGVSEKQMKQAKEYIKDNPDILNNLNPDAQRVIRGMEAELKKNTKSLSREEIQNALKTAQQRLLPTMPPGTSVGGANPKALGRPVRMPMPVPTTAANPPSGTPPFGPYPKPENRDDDPSAMKRLAEFVSRLDKSLPHSPAMQHAMGDLRKSFGDDDPNWRKLTSGARALSEKWSRWTESVHAERFVPQKELSWPKSLMPSWRPQVHWPSALPSPGRSRSANSAAASATTEAPNWQILLGVFGLVLLGYALWRLWARSQTNAAAGGTAVWRLGPWPVDPAAVMTRDELIRAFEYLSLLRLGPAARNWNHRTIASGLGSAAPSPVGGSDIPPKAVANRDPGERRRVADQLAALYERARYAPLDDPLPDGALVAARRDLCFLAGVSAA